MAHCSLSILLGFFATIRIKIKSQIKIKSLATTKNKFKPSQDLLNFFISKLILSSLISELFAFDYAFVIRVIFSDIFVNYFYHFLGSGYSKYFVVKLFVAHSMV